jgi:hypothetical protein
VDDVKEMLKKKKKHSRSLGLGAVKEVALSSSTPNPSKHALDTPVPRLKYAVGVSTPEIMQRAPKTTRDDFDEEIHTGRSPYVATASCKRIRLLGADVSI